MNIEVLRKIYGWLFLLAVMAACQSVDLIEEPEEEVYATFNLGISVEAEQLVGEASGRAIFIDPGPENLIYDIWVLQFAATGQRIGSPEHYRYQGEPGSLELTGDSIELAVREESIVCLVANLGSNTTADRWNNSDNFAAFCQEMTKINFNENGSIGNQADGFASLPMFGYYRGPTLGNNGNNSLDVCLGRLVARVTLVIKNKTSSNMTGMWVRVNNAPHTSSIYVNRLPLPAGGPTYYGTYKEKVGNDGTLVGGEKSGSLGAGMTSTHYFYMAENLVPTTENITSVDIGIGNIATDYFSKKVNVKLGTDPPFLGENVSNRNYNLGRNNGYTCTINLVN